MTWRPSASNIARDAPGYATVFAERAFQAVAHLEQFPRSGRIVPEIHHDDIREVIFQSYRIIYRVRPDEIEILTIHHGARLLDRFERPD